MGERAEQPERPVSIPDLRRQATEYAVPDIWGHELLALVEAAEALAAIRRRIPVDPENEDGNGWGRVDKALARFEEER